MRKGNPVRELKKNGFTLVELMIVLVIIGLLVAILIPNLIDATHRARQRATVGELRAWGNALGAYMAEVGMFPPGIGAPDNASTIHSQLVPYAVSALHDQDSWKWNFQYEAPTLANSPTNYTVLSPGKNGIVDFCVNSLNWFNYGNDIAISDGLFICSPS